MVFCGRPSRGCSSCRKRRIKCDEIRPSCSQCLRATRDCNGYREQNDVLFRNENDRITHQVLKRTTCMSSDVILQTSTRQKTNGKRPPESESIPIHALHHPLEDQGLSFFFSTYVALPGDPHSTHQSHASPNVLWPEVCQNSSLFHAVSPVGFAGLSNVTGDLTYAVTAAKRVAITLKKVQVALNNSRATDIESVFNLVILLSAFELASQKPGQNVAWAKHVEGGAALLETLEQNKIQTIPHRFQLKLCLSLFVTYITNEQICPPSIQNWYERLQYAASEFDKPAISLIGIMIKITNLIAHTHLLSTIDPTILIENALEINEEMDAWEEELPQDWQFESRPIDPGHATSFVDTSLRYQNRWAARIWTDYRWARIILNDLILGKVSRSAANVSRYAADAQNCLKLNCKMASEICAIISPNAGYDYEPDRGSPTSGCMSQDGTQVGGAFLVLHPLFVAAKAFGVSESVHDIAIGKLHDIGYRMGVRAALELAKLATEDRATWRDWMSTWQKTKGVDFPHDDPSSGDV